MMFSADLNAVVDDVLARYQGESDLASLWSSALDMDWTKIGMEERLGGPGGTIADLAEVAAGVGRYAIALPIWQTALASWFLATAGLPLERALGGTIIVDEPGLLQVNGGQDSWNVSLSVEDVALSDQVASVVIIGERAATGWVGVLDRAQLPEPHGRSLAGDPLHDLVIAGAKVDSASAAWVSLECLEELRTRTRLLQAATIAGAVSRICDLTREHVQTRQQFGRPLIALQAVAHRLADMLCQRDLLAAALQEALSGPARETASAALILAVEAAEIVAGEAHTLHGAMGVTEEHILHRFTTRLWEITGEVRSARPHAEQLGTAVTGGTGDTALWDISSPGPHEDRSMLDDPLIRPDQRLAETPR